MSTSESRSITPANPPYPPYAGTDTEGFALPTVSKRWPVIITSVIDDVYRAYHEPPSSDANATEKHEREGKKLIAQLGGLKYEVQHRGALRKIEEDGLGDAEEWNKMLETFFPSGNFYTVSWLFAECYLYRRIKEAFQQTETWKDYDPFWQQKTNTFRESTQAILELAERFSELVEKDLDDINAKLLFHELAQVCLWGNATDLSLLTNITQDDIRELQSRGGKNIIESEKNIIANDLDKVWEYVRDLSGARIDFILDNSGFELYSDLILADHLHQTGHASKTVFHCKTIPWFVSDTTVFDFRWLLSAISAPSSFFPASDFTQLITLSRRWQDYINRGEWVITAHKFWCSGWAYHHIKEQAPELFADLASSSLLIFKGDLNYRKLVYDCKWPTTTPFRQAIGPVMADEAPPLVVLRTNKADTCVGLMPGKEEELLSKGEKDWRWSGKYAVVEFSR